MKHLSHLIMSIKNRYVNYKTKKDIVRKIKRLIMNSDIGNGAKVLSHMNVMLLGYDSGKIEMSLIKNGDDEMILLAALSAYMTISAKIDKEEKMERILNYWTSMKEVETIQ